MGCSLGPSLPNAFLSNQEKNWLAIVRKDLSQFFTDIMSIMFYTLQIE